MRRERKTLPIAVTARGVVDEVEREKNRIKSKVRSRVEHAIGVMKRCSVREGALSRTEKNHAAGERVNEGELEDKTKFIDGVMTRKATVKSLEWPELTVQIVGSSAIARHLWVAESELDGKVTNTKIGVIQVWQKQDGGWKLLARASWRLPPQA